MKRTKPSERFAQIGTRVSPPSCRRFLSLMKRLISLGLVRVFPQGSCEESPGIFSSRNLAKTVQNIDARRANRLFAPPFGVELCTAESCAQLVSRAFFAQAHGFRDDGRRTRTSSWTHFSRSSFSLMAFHLLVSVCCGATVLSVPCAS